MNTIIQKKIVLIKDHQSIDVQSEEEYNFIKIKLEQEYYTFYSNKTSGNLKYTANYSLNKILQYTRYDQTNPLFTFNIEPEEKVGFSINW